MRKARLLLKPIVTLTGTSGVFVITSPYPWEGFVHSRIYSLTDIFHIHFLNACYKVGTVPGLEDRKMK